MKGIDPKQNETVNQTLSAKKIVLTLQYGFTLSRNNQYGKIFKLFFNKMIKQTTILTARNNSMSVKQILKKNG